MGGVVSIPAVSTRWRCDPAESTRMWSCSASVSEPDYSPVLLTLTGNRRPLKIKAGARRDNVHLRLNKEDLLLLWLSRPNESPLASQAFCRNLFKSCELGLVMSVWKVKLHSLYNAQLIIWTGICLAWQAAGTAGLVKSGILYVCVCEQKTRKLGRCQALSWSVARSLTSDTLVMQVGRMVIGWQ